MCATSKDTSLFCQCDWQQKSLMLLVPGHSLEVIHNSTNVGAAIALAVITRISRWSIKVMTHASVVANLMSQDLEGKIMLTVDKHLLPISGLTNSIQTNHNQACLRPNEGKAQYSWLPYWCRLFCEKVNKVCNIKNSRYKLITTKISKYWAFPFRKNTLMHCIP